MREEKQIGRERGPERVCDKLSLFEENIPLILSGKHTVSSASAMCELVHVCVHA